MSVSCARPGNCSAGGYLSGSSSHQAFVVSQDNGMWGTAVKVPGLAASQTSGIVNSVSCTSAGNCGAGGYYTRPPGTDQRAFVVAQKNGRWGQALPVRGMAEVDSVSCASAGNCSAGGYIAGTSGFQRGFVVSQHNGTWGKAEEIPGLAALNRGGFAVVSSVSRALAGNCGAGGLYENRAHRGRAFVVSQAS